MGKMGEGEPEPGITGEWPLEWETIRQTIAHSPWAEAVYRHIRAKTEGWIAHYEDGPDRVAGWGHNYFCGRCFVRIPFRANERGVHRCAACGHDNEGAAFDEAWNYLYRDETHKTVFYAAVLHRLDGDERYVHFIRKVLRLYSEHYEQFRVNVKSGLVGKLAGLDLSDAVGVIWLLQGLQLIKEQFSDAELDVYKRRLFLPEAEMFLDHSDRIHNIPCWMLCAAAMVGMFFGEEAPLQRALYGEFGLERQLREGLTREGFWLEGSFHYHFYCAEPFAYLLGFARIYGVELSALREQAKRMYTYPVEMAFRNGRFPNPNDGWPLVAFSSYAGQYEWMNMACGGDDRLEHALSLSYGEHYVPSFISGGMCESTPNGWVQRLLFGKDEYRRGAAPRLASRCDADTQFCMLRRGELEVFMKFGFHVRSHSHPDAMNIEIGWGRDIVSYDISNSGYGAALCGEWQRRTISHNTVVVDGRDHEARRKGGVEWFDEAENRCRVRSNDVYGGVDFVRELAVDDGQLEDTFEVISGETHQYDWMFHCAGELEHAFAAERTESPPGSDNGYQHLLNVRTYATDGNWEVRWRLPDKQVILRMEGCPGTRIYLFEGYEYAADHIRSGVLVRRTAATTVYRANYRFDVLGADWQ